MPLAMKSLEKGAVEVISMGIRDLDEMTFGGMKPKELWVIGAQPGGGKSSLARQLERAAISKGVGIPPNRQTFFFLSTDAGNITQTTSSSATLSRRRS